MALTHSSSPAQELIPEEQNKTVEQTNTHPESTAAQDQPSRNTYKNKIIAGVVGIIGIAGTALGLNTLADEDDQKNNPAPVVAVTPDESIVSDVNPSPNPTTTVTVTPTTESVPVGNERLGPFSSTADGYPLAYSLLHDNSEFVLENFQNGDSDLVDNAEQVRKRIDVELGSVDIEREFGTIISFPLTYSNPTTDDLESRRLMIINPVVVTENNRKTYYFRDGREASSPSYAVTVENWGENNARSSVQGITIDHSPKYLGKSRQYTQFSQVPEEDRLIPESDDTWPTAQITHALGAAEPSYAGIVVVIDNGDYSVGFTRPQFEESRLAFNEQLLLTANTPLAGSTSS